jgi:hypothetical protein
MRTFRVVALLCLLAGLALRPSHVRADDAETLDRFLSRLGLVDLQILHLEEALQRQRDSAPRERLARRLADLYAERLMVAADDKPRYEEIVGRMEALIAAVPQANTTALQVMLLQADYSRGEAHIVKWLDEPSDRTALDEAAKVLAPIAPRLNQYQQELNAAAEKLFAEIDQSADEEARAVKEAELSRQQALAGRATYFAGWASYYLGVAKQNPSASQKDFAAARDAFRKLLGIESDNYEEIDLEWLGLESIWRSRALIGLGLAEAATGNLAASRACFQMLEHVSTPPAIRDLGAYWYLQGLLNAKHFPEATEYAAEQVEKYSGGATQGKISFCVALIRAGFAGDAASPHAQTLGELGVRGLARLRQIQVLRQLISKYKIQLEDGGGFYLAWVKGQQQFAEAEKSQSDADYTAAADTLTAALADTQARNDVGSAADCRYTLAWCYYRLGQFEKAAQHFQQASAALKQAGGDSAVQAAWMAFASYQRLATAEGRSMAAAIDVLQSIKRDFPASEQAKKADYYIAKLQQTAASPDASIRTLSNIKPDDPNYPSARYEICLLYYQLWSNVRGDSRAASAAADVRLAVDQFLAASRQDEDDQRKLRCILLAVDVTLNTAPPSADQAQTYLDQAKPLAESMSPQSPLPAEYHYRRYQMARDQSDAAALHTEAMWLARNAIGSAYELPAVVTLAKSADAALKSATAAEHKRRLEEARRIYDRLVELLGESSSAIAASNNALVANSRLAQYEYDAGDFADAARRMEIIVAALPNNKDYLRRAGLAQFYAQNYNASLQHWRTVLSGTESDSPDWFEAKYYQLACLERVDPPAAQTVFKQFKLLHPDLGPAAWRDKFRELEGNFS